MNPTEHRLFSEISKNWAGVPLDTVETILNYIRTTTAKTGLTMNAQLIPGECPTGISIPDEQMAALDLTCHEPLPQSAALCITVNSILCSMDCWRQRERPHWVFSE